MNKECCDKESWKCLERPPVHLTAAVDYLIVPAVIVSNLRMMKYIYIIKIILKLQSFHVESFTSKNKVGTIVVVFYVCSCLK